jgi:hypothetical protein
MPASDHLEKIPRPWSWLLRAIRDFAGVDNSATYLWPRWLLLRAVGFVFIFVFAGIITEAQALLGPRGIVPLDEFFLQLRGMFPGAVDAFVAAPSLFWLNTSSAWITLLSWTGLMAAIALVLNLWPRITLFACWLVFLSFAATWRIFSPAQLDNLMLEAALLCVPFAPAGFRPGLGAASPPRPIALFMVRWLLFRVMFESGVVKFAAGDPHWRNFTAMEVMYETSPFPTIFGYWDHHLPHAWHLVEITLTLAAELAAPVLAIFAGRPGRWFAFIVWTAFQLGIQLTNNFGWLNVASIGLGLALLDDQMLAAVAARLKLRRFSPPAATALCATPNWRTLVLRTALWTHFALSLVLLAKSCNIAVLPALAAPAKLVSEFRSVNAYTLYATFVTERYQVEFEGSNDAGRTWRAYDYRFLPQHPDQIAPFIAPWFARFEATIQIAAWGRKRSEIIPVVASHLLARNPEVMDQFRSDPFPDHPPTIIRMRGYRLAFTDPDTRRRTGHYWHKEFVGDYLPALWQNERGEIAEFNLTPADDALRAGDLPRALAFLEQQFGLGNLEAGLRLADMFARGQGVRPDPERAFALFSNLAARGELSAAHNVATCHEFGVGTPIDLAKAAALYRSAADRGYALSFYNLGAMHAQQKRSPRDDVTGLALLLQAKARARGDDPISRFIREDRAGHQKRLLERMSPGDIALARQRAGFLP